MLTRLETARLILRPFEDADVGAAFGWMCDPVVMQFMPLGAFAHEDNHASLHVLKKVGFREQRRDLVMDIPAIVFELPPDTTTSREVT